MKGELPGTPDARGGLAEVAVVSAQKLPRARMGTSRGKRLAGVPSVRRGASSAAAALFNAIGEMESAARLRESMVYGYWPRVVGPQMAAASEVDEVRDGVVFVRTRSSVWSHEFVFYQERIRKELNRLVGAEIITNLVFRARGVQRNPAGERRDAPDDAELAALILEPAEQEELAGILGRLREIPDEETRRVCAARIEAEMRLRHWRLDHGWRLCSRCSAACRPEGSLCPICRLTGR
ncbi:MAG TPA: DUF721 domain-containing protein [Chthonomonadales bacterium]|nr:DUF721 domain-containing protein [Chthonomonadales bacterium]